MTEKYIHIISKEKAKELGMTRYFTGEPCDKGHVVERSCNNNMCVECQKVYQTERYKRKKEEDPDFFARYFRNWRKKNPDYYKNNENTKRYQREYHKSNRDKIQERQNKRRRDNPEYKMKCYMRIKLNKILDKTGCRKSKSSSKTLGYSGQELREHLESLMLEGMSWQNYGTEWHIDHAVPISRLISDGVEDAAIINSLSNLLPMWAEHNLEKGDSTLEEYMEVREDLLPLYGGFLENSQKLLKD